MCGKWLGIIRDGNKFLEEIENFEICARTKKYKEFCDAESAAIRLIKKMKKNNDNKYYYDVIGEYEPED